MIKLTILNKPIHFRTHTEFSLLESTIRIKDIANESAIAITDTHNLFGLHRFTTQCRSQRIHPITGCAVKINDKTLYLYAQNHAGYQNLCQVLSNSELSGLKSFDELIHHTEGLFALLGENGDAAWINKLQDAFPKRWAIALCNYGTGYNTPAEMLKASVDLQIPLVASNIAYFASDEEYEAHDAFSCIAKHEHVDAPGRSRLSMYHRLLKEKDWESLFSDAPEAVSNTLNLSRKCSFILQNAKQIAYSSPTHEEQLRQLSYDGLVERIANLDNKQKYYDQLEYELKIINQLGMAGYFLIVADYVRWARQHHIPVNCRGSGAGSVVAWAIQITNIDPLHFSLVFERFLNPERVSMADFDLDFCHERREEVIKYICQKYGQGNVAQIATFGTMQPRAILRDIGRVLGMRFGEIDAICKMIPFNPIFDITLKSARETQKELDKLITHDTSVQRLWKICERLEGLPRHVSTHAAGIVISDKPLNENIPLYCEPSASMKVSGFDMYALEKVGFIKFDILGLSSLTMIQKILDMLKADNICVDIEKIPFEDPEVFKYLSTGNTYGVFQLDSMGIRQIIQQMQPEKIEDLVALNALYRPGPVQNIPKYLDYKKDPSKIPYIFPELANILDETYGIIIYQEQVLQIARVIAGYSLAEADLLRRAIGKKIESEMQKQKSSFISRAIALGRDEEKTAELFGLIEKFAQYGFVKAHATCYAVSMYQMAYLKTHFTKYFICVGMTMDSNHHDKLIQWKREADYAQIVVKPPCVCTSREEFTLEGDAIRYSLSAIKSVGVGLAKQICTERDRRPFHDVWDFAKRAAVNKQALEGLIKSGALDVFGTDRGTLLHNTALLLHQPEDTLFPPMLNEAPPLPRDTLFQHVFESVGMYVDAHPLDDISNKLLRYLGINSVMQEGDIIGYVLKIERRRTKAGKLYGILMISDPSGINEFSIFSEQWTDAQKQIRENDLVQCSVKSRRGLMIQSIKRVNDGLDIPSITLKSPSVEILTKLKNLHTGDTQLLIAHEERWEIARVKVDLNGLRVLSEYFKA